MLSAWDVFLLFLIPIGGGIPAGVVLAKQRGFDWPLMMILYFFSDVTLAFLFEPILLIFLKLSKHSAGLAKFIATVKVTLDKSVARYGVNPGPLTLVLISFGVDPMTGRSAAKAAGHHFISGWILAIAGDMIFFAILMVSTLFLNGILGDGTWTAVIIMVAMIAIPALVRRLRGRMSVRGRTP